MILEAPSEPLWTLEAPSKGGLGKLVDEGRVRVLDRHRHRSRVLAWTLWTFEAPSIHLRLLQHIHTRLLQYMYIYIRGSFNTFEAPSKPTFEAPSIHVYKLVDECRVRMLDRHRHRSRVLACP